MLQLRYKGAIKRTSGKIKSVECVRARAQPPQETEGSCQEHVAPKSPRRAPEKVRAATDAQKHGALGGTHSVTALKGTQLLACSE